jgi:hypothetical protein
LYHDIATKISCSTQVRLLSVLPRDDISIMCNNVLAVTFPMLFLSCAVWMVSVSNADVWEVLFVFNIKGAVSCPYDPGCLLGSAGLQKHGAACRAIRNYEPLKRTPNSDAHRKQPSDFLTERIYRCVGLYLNFCWAFWCVVVVAGARVVF